MSAVLFEDYDSGCLGWLGWNPEGYVISICRRFDPGCVVLHRADCPTISRYPDIKRNPSDSRRAEGFGID